MLYEFDILNRWLDERDYPKIDGHSGGFHVIKGIDFEKAYKADSIEFKDDGVYLKFEDKEYRGYMFIKEPYIERYDSYPKFHLTKCRTILEFINTGKFKDRYEWSNSDINDLIDKTSRKVFKDEVLDLCSNCSQQIHDEIYNTKDFFDSIDRTDIESENVEVDIFGYCKNWNLISRHYRKKKNYTCEECGVASQNSYHNRYWHVHHIDGNKANCKDSNLQCLCIRCHSEVDARHEENFKEPKLKRQFSAFMVAYGSHNLTDITLRLRDYLMREHSNKRYQPQINLDKLYYLLSEKWMRESRKKKVKEYTEKALETVKTLGLLLSYDIKKSSTGEPKVVFKLNKDWE